MGLKPLLPETDFFKTRRSILEPEEIGKKGVFFLV